MSTALAPGAGMRRGLVTVFAMCATIMQALDTTIANVALPHMQGSLSASLDQINWVLTSYIVASAIMTAPIAWIADRFGRKRLFVGCVVGFTVASALCGLSQNIQEIVLFRLLQGVFGAGLIPLSQAMLLDLYSAKERAQAMSIWGVGVMLGPIMGPTLGAWLTDHYSWHSVFFINVPVGILTVFGLLVFMHESERKRDRPFDWLGFIALALAIGSLQLMLDRGEQLGWFSSPEIVTEAIIAAVGFYYFLAHALTARHPFLRLELFRDRSFVACCLFMLVIGVVLFGTMALITPFMQIVRGYPVLTAGIILASRGLGTLISMALVGQLMKFIEARYLVITGLLLSAFTLYQMAGFSDQTPSSLFLSAGMIQGFGVGLVFVPLSTAAFVTLAGHLRTEGSALLTLVRNIGSSIGISIVISQLTNGAARSGAYLGEHVTPFNNALQASGVSGILDPASQQGLGMLDRMVQQQAMIISYDNDFMLLTYLTLAALPFAFLIGSSRFASEGSAGLASAADQTSA